MTPRSRREGIARRTPRPAAFSFPWSRRCRGTSLDGNGIRPVDPPASARLAELRLVESFDAEQESDDATEEEADLAAEGVKLNVTALLTLAQVHGVAQALNPAIPSVVSVFAGRIADTGVDPVPLMRACGPLLEDLPKAELLWASTREVLNLFQADECGCKIITVPHDILAKAAKMIGLELAAVSLDTVKGFLKDSTEAGFKL